MDLIPRLYDTERIVRIRDAEGKEDFVEINTPVAGKDGKPLLDKEGQQVYVNKMDAGKYDVIVTTEDSATTRRQEAAELLGQVLQGQPELMNVIGDIWAKNLDAPGAEEMAARLYKMVPPELKEKSEEKDEQTQEEEAPPPPTPEQQLEMRKLEIENRKLDIEEAKIGAEEGAGSEEQIEMIRQIVLDTMAEAHGAWGLTQRQKTSSWSTLMIDSMPGILLE